MRGCFVPAEDTDIAFRYDNNDLKFHSTTGAFSPQQFFEYLQGAFDTLLDEGLAGKPKMVRHSLVEDDGCRLTIA
jgi:hypothetical protein